MFRLLTILSALVIGTFAFCATAVASEPEPSSEETSLEETAIDDLSAPQELVDDFGLAHRQRIYEASRLEKRHALMYTALFPGIGNFYAEQYALGTVAMMAMVFSGMFLGYGIVNDHSDLRTLGITTAVLTYTTSGTAAYLGVRSHNANLRRSLHIDNPHSALFSHATVESPEPYLLLEVQWQF